MTTNYETDIKGQSPESDFTPELSSPCFSLLRLKQDNQPELPMNLHPTCFSIRKLKQDA
jgi:hypothetical protein